MSVWNMCRKNQPSLREQAAEALCPQMRLTKLNTMLTQ